MTVLALLGAAGIVTGRRGRAGTASAPSGLTSCATDRRPILRSPVVVQVSRWDRMKDMAGVLDGFARHVHASPAHLVLAGPAVTGVSDDPEGEAVWDETVAAWRALVDV